MECHKNAGCFRIYHDIYPTAKESINSSINKIIESITDIESTLSELYVPDDYLGEKVKREIGKINECFDSDKKSINKAYDSIKSDIDTYINVHKQHYVDYRALLEMEENAKRAAEQGSNSIEA